MSTTTNTNVDSAAIMAKIREEVTLRKLALSNSGSANEQPRIVKAQGMEFKPVFSRLPTQNNKLDVKSVYSVHDITQFHDVDFLQNAYQVILERKPDEKGFNHYLDSLRHGRLSKIDILGRLRYSSEGRRIGTPIKGLLLPCLFRLIFRIPILGYFIECTKLVLRLPVIVRNIQVLEANLITGNQQLKARLNNILAEHENAVHALADIIISDRNSSAQTQRLVDAKMSLLDSQLGKIPQQNDLAKVFDEKLAAYDLPALLNHSSQLAAQVTELKRSAIDQQRRLSLIIEEVRKRLPEPLSAEQMRNLAAEESHFHDAFYVSFEDKFRGSRQEIKQRSEVYLPIIEHAGAGSIEAPVLDIGCGRGEWLEVLRDHGLNGKGIDLNRVMVAQCRDEFGLEAVEADVFEYLHGLKDATFGAVTGLHIIEHFPFRRLVSLLHEVLRVLKPGGVAIFETPNPENLIVGACNFYYDPTHINPLPPGMIEYLVEAHGFVRPRIMRLTEHRTNDDPFGPEQSISTGIAAVDSLVKLTREKYFCAPDYAVVAYKA